MYNKPILVLSIFIVVLLLAYSVNLLVPGTTAQSSGNCGDATPDALDIRYAPLADTSPKVTMDQAIEIASKNAFVVVDTPSTTTTARYVSFSDNVRGTADKIGDDDSVRLDFQNVPAWVVTFCGLDIPPHLRRGGVRPAKVNNAHEWNVVINAETGEYMEEYSFR